MTTLAEDLLMKIAGYDYISPLHVTNKGFYKRFHDKQLCNVVKLQKWYKKRMINIYPPECIWKERGLMIRLYLTMYSGEWEQYWYTLPDSIIRKFTRIDYIKEEHIKSGLEEAYTVFNNSGKKKSDVLHFLLTNNLNAYYYNIYGV